MSYVLCRATIHSIINVDERVGNQLLLDVEVVSLKGRNYVGNYGGWFGTFEDYGAQAVIP